ncbi:uncharacterized protein LOC128961402 [Oppia nitens]|uniref:uncharacterized protein LOC128961402 n=1 Tax=Oppia nitens TaxID=1686743 RepID=UPI0023DA39A6|nr:uncharacterized protein LOC128961402 [Oppia nitens]
MEDKSETGLISGDTNLSLLSIASALRRGSPLNEGINQTIGDKVVSKLIGVANTEQSSELSINETIEQMSDLSLNKKSETLQSIGNRLANNGLYMEAIKYYSKAIAFYDEDYRLYCNRSFCYEKLMKYEESLADALRSVILMPTKPKPYFRQGKALIGLKRYSDAEKAFIKILQINGNCEDTNKELLKTRYLALRDYGLNIEDASLAAINYNSIEVAIKASEDKNKKIANNLLTNRSTSYDSLMDPNLFEDNKQSNQCNHQYRQWMQSEKQSISTTKNHFNGYRRSQSRPPARQTFSCVNCSHSSHTNCSNASKSPQYVHKRSQSVDNALRVKRQDQVFVRKHKIAEHRLPKNLFGYKGLWIGNVSPGCRPSLLWSIFAKYGPLDYVNVVPKSYCAFVNYFDKNSPRIAIASLYGQTVCGVSNGERPLVFRFIPSNDQKDLHYMRPYQPRGTNECYFWRTTGCKDHKCPLLHYPMCKGIDFQPWMNRKFKK